MVRKIRSDKKDTTCDRCGRILANPNKLREHLRRKNPCKAKTDTSIQPPIQMPIQTFIQAPVQAPPVQESNQQLIQEVIQEPVQIPIQINKESDQIPKPESLVEVKNLPSRNQLIRTRLTINKHPEESLKEWATRLADRIDELTGIKQYRSWLRLRKRLQ